VRFVALLCGLGLVAVIAACGGGGEASPTAIPASPTSTLTAAPSAVASMTDEELAAEALLKAAALQTEDLPSDLTLAEEKFTTNEDEAEQENILTGAPTAEDLSRWGRILGYQASYSPDTQSITTGATLSFLVETDVYRDSDGAEQHFEVIRQQPSDPGFVAWFQEDAKAAGVDVQDASVSELPFIEVGDNQMAYELRLDAHYADLDQDLSLITQIVGIRRGRALGFITMITIDSPSPVGVLEDLTRTLDQRMKDALE
jgi:hypothetical protein